MNTKEYEQKMEKILKERPYEIITKNPINKITKQLNEAIKKAITDEKLKKKLTVPILRLPRMYGVPKIHKGVPLRPIVSAINSPTYNVEKYLTTIQK